jgi:DNA-binding XRE family transcriptional regulator
MKKVRKPIYPGLVAEMRRNGETQEDLSKVLGISRTQTSLKLLGRYEWTIGEIEAICNHYKKNYYELFKGE